MEFAIKQDDISININAPEEATREIKNFFKGFVEIVEPVKNPTYTVDFSTNFSAAPESCIEFKESNAVLKSKIKVGQDKSVVYLNDQEDIKKTNNLCLMLVTNVYARMLDNNGYYLLHCSCVAKNGKALVVCGNKNTGKTVNLINLVGNGFSFVTNDMLAIKVIDGKLVCHGMPHHIGIRMTSPWIDQPENLKYLNFAYERNFKINLENPGSDENKFYISPKRLTRLNDVTICQSAELIGILNSVYTSEVSNLRLSRLSKQYIKDLVLSQKLESLHSSKKFLEQIVSKNPLASQLSKNMAVEKMSELLSYQARENEMTMENIAIISNGMIRKAEAKENAEEIIQEK